MSVLCNPAPWPSSCIEALARVLESGDGIRLASWLVSHVEDSPESWIQYVAAVAAIGSGLHAEMGAEDGTEFWAPGADPSLPQAARDAEVVLSMMLNGDIPGLVGACEGIRSRGGFEDMAGALASHTTAMLQLEASVRGAL